MSILKLKGSGLKEIDTLNSIEFHVFLYTALELNLEDF